MPCVAAACAVLGGGDLLSLFTLCPRLLLQRPNIQQPREQQADAANGKLPDRSSWPWHQIAVHQRLAAALDDDDQGSPLHADLKASHSTS